MIQNKIRYLALLAVAGLLSILYNEYFMGVLFLTIVVLPFVMFGMLCYLYGRITAAIDTTVHVANRGETIPILIHFNNPTIMPVSNIEICLSYKNSFSGKKYKREFMVSLDQRTKTTVTCNILSEHAGNLTVSLMKVRIHDYLKLFSLSRKQNSEVKVAVLPKIHELVEEYVVNRSKTQVESDYFSPVRGGDDPSEVFRIREYREGDRLTRIHWKLSMKQDQLMIKEFSDPLNCSILVFISLYLEKGQDRLTYMDALLEYALSISFSFLLKDQIHYISWYDESHGVCKRIRVVQEKDLYEAVDGLLESIPYSMDVNSMGAYLAEYPNGQYTDLLYVTGEVTESQLDSLSMIKANIKQIIYVSNSSYNTEYVDEKSSISLPLKEDLIRKISELGIGLKSVNYNNLGMNVEALSEFEGGIL